MEQSGLQTHTDDFFFCVLTSVHIYTYSSQKKGMTLSYMSDAIKYSSVQHYTNQTYCTSILKHFLSSLTWQQNNPLSRH